MLSLIFLAPFLILVLIITLIGGMGFLITKKSLYWKMLLYTWVPFLFIILCVVTVIWLENDVVLAKKDFYGTYRINRDYFPGEDAEWQYDHFKFDILENDSIHFYVTKNDSVVRVYKGKVFFNESYKSVRIRFDMLSPVHHVMSDQPLIIRSRWDFDIVMHSSLFNNMYFEKTSW
jgi:hypothetical protein